MEKSTRVDAIPLVFYNTLTSKYQWTKAGSEARQIVIKHAHLRNALNACRKSALQRESLGSILQESKFSNTAYELLDLPIFDHVCLAIVESVCQRLEVEIWREARLIGNAAVEIANKGHSSCSASCAMLRLIIQKSSQWAALIKAPLDLLGDVAHVAPQPPQLRLLSVTKVLAQAWTQALADVSWYLAEHEMKVPSAKQDKEHEQALALYHQAYGQHQAWASSCGPSWVPAMSPVQATRELLGPNLPEGLVAPVLASLSSSPSGASVHGTASMRPGMSMSATASITGAATTRRKASDLSFLATVASGSIEIGAVTVEAASPTVLVATHVAHSAFEIASQVTAESVPWSASSGALMQACGRKLQRILSVSEKAENPLILGSGQQVPHPSGQVRYLTLHRDVLSALLLGMAPDRGRRLASTPSLLMLPAADFRHEESESSQLKGEVHTAAISDGAAHVAVLMPEVGCAAAAAEAVELTAQGPSSTQLFVGKPPAGPSKKVQPNAFVRDIPRGPSSMGSQVGTLLHPGSKGSLSLLALTLFLSQAWRSISALGNMCLLVMGDPEPSEEEGAEKGSPFSNRQLMQQRRGAPYLVLTRPGLSRLLQEVVGQAEQGRTDPTTGRDALLLEEPSKLSEVLVHAAGAARGFEGLLAAVVRRCSTLVEFTQTCTLKLGQGNSLQSSSSRNVAGHRSSSGPASPSSVMWPASYLLQLLLEYNRPAERLTDSDPQSASACILTAVLELVVATVLTAQGHATAVYQTQLLYPMDATVEDMVLAHSLGLRLFEHLHALLESVKAMLQKRWDDAVLQTAGVIGGVEGGRSPLLTASSSPLRKLGKSISLSSKASEASDSYPIEEVVKQARNSSDSQQRGSGGSFSIISAFRKVIRQSSGSATNKVFPATSSDLNVGDDSSHEPGLSQRHHKQGESITALPKRLALQLTWRQRAVLERQRKLLIQLRMAVAEVGEKIVNTFQKNARGCYHQLSKDAWASKTKPIKGTEGTENMVKGLLRPLRDSLLASGIHSQTRSYLFATVLSAAMQVMEEQVQQSLANKVKGSAALRLHCGIQLDLDLEIISSEIAQYEEYYRSLASSQLTKGGDMSEDWTGIADSVAILRRQMSSLRSAYC